MDAIDLQSLWEHVRFLARQEPYCYGSERRAHTDAAKDMAEQQKLSGEDLAEWNRHVWNHTSTMSYFAGD